MIRWLLEYDEYRPDEEQHREALCTLGNGYFATRGAAPETSADGVHYPGTYVAGLYDRAVTEISGREITNEDLVNAPNWLPFTFKVDDGEWFDIDAVEILDFHQELDMKRGVLTRKVRFEHEGRTSLYTQRRVVHMGHRHVAALQSTLVAEDWSGTVRFRTALDGTVENTGVERYRDLESDHMTEVEQGFEDPDTMYVVARTKQSRVRVAVAARTRLYDGEKEMIVRRHREREAGYVAEEFGTGLAEGDSVTVEKIACLFTSMDRAITEPLTEAIHHVGRSRTFEDLLRFQALTWDHLWNRFRMRIKPGERQQMVLNLHTFHLLQTVSTNSIDLDVGVPARGWHGEAYRGHIFWDELFIFPFLNLRLPELTRALLMYRYRRLPEARNAANEAGYRGAMYPWQSGSNGREESQVVHLNPRSGEWVPDNTHLQRHVNLAIAYNVWQYYQVTGDLEFMSYYGAEIILEVARFFASLATYERAKDRFEIRNVMGPDEYHDAYPDSDEHGLHNNAYTNVLTVWLMTRALRIQDIMPHSRWEALRDRLTITSEEMELWEDVSRKMFVPFHDDGVISQFEGYEELEEFDWHGYRAKYGDIHRLDRILGAEGDSVNRYKASKQADVLMLFYLFSLDELEDLFERIGLSVDEDMVKRNVQYYSRRTSHGSTLSGIVHSWVLARMDREQSWELFLDALESDVADIQGGTTKEGIHLGAMAGTVDLVQRGYTGIVTLEDELRVNPQLPAELDEISLNVRYRGQWVNLRFRCDELVITTDPGETTASINILVGDEHYEVGPGMVERITLDEDCDEDR